MGTVARRHTEADRGIETVPGLHIAELNRGVGAGYLLDRDCVHLNSFSVCANVRALTYVA
jgi:hypothetical protein